MSARYYDIKLKCGCMLSLDDGGGLIPCSLGSGLTDDGEKRELTEEEKKQEALHDKTWDAYRASDEFKVHQAEIEIRNR